MGAPMAAPGFFGKLPSHGDFVGRRLPAPVRDCFDTWLQGALVQSKLDLGEAWLPAWLNSPLWRFLIGAGICSDQAWAGVMMPSHDQVGRCFPLLLAAAIDGTPLLRTCLEQHAGWFAVLEELALSTLDEGFSLEAFDAALMSPDVAAARSGLSTKCSPSAVARRAGLAGRAVVAVPVLGKPPALADSFMPGESAWWTGASPGVASCLVICTSLPPAVAFASLIDGHWAGRGWDVARMDGNAYPL